MTNDIHNSPQKIVKRVLNLLEAELRRQATGGRLEVKSRLGIDGLIEVSGHLDLASFAAATELALRSEFSL